MTFGKSFRGKAREAEEVRRIFSYAAATENEAQHSI
jgi:hypothetical protein